MLKHEPNVPRPMTEIERIIHNIEPQAPDELPGATCGAIQVPGFRNPHDPRIPAALRQAALTQRQQRRGRHK